jgi:hypothetical protein
VVVPNQFVELCANRGKQAWRAKFKAYVPIPAKALGVFRRRLVDQGPQAAGNDTVSKADNIERKACCVTECDNSRQFVERRPRHLETAFSTSSNFPERDHGRLLRVPPLTDVFDVSAKGFGDLTKPVYIVIRDIDLFVATSVRIADGKLTWMVGREEAPTRGEPTHGRVDALFGEVRREVIDHGLCQGKVEVLIDRRKVKVVDAEETGVPGFEPLGRQDASASKVKPPGFLFNPEVVTGLQKCDRMPPASEGSAADVEQVVVGHETLGPQEVELQSAHALPLLAASLFVVETYPVSDGLETLSNSATSALNVLCDHFFPCPCGGRPGGVAGGDHS